MADPKTPQRWQDITVNKGQLTCPVCKGDDWQPGALISVAVADERSQTIVPGVQAVMAQLFCGRCKYLLLFNVGVLDADELAL